MLADSEIRRAMMLGDLSILPPDGDLLRPEQMQPASVDLRLGSKFMFAKSVGEGAPGAMMLDDDPQDWFYDVEEHKRVVLTPGDFVLASTLERVRLSSRFSARVEGRSSIGRRGLIVHTTAGFIDPGFDGEITLELANVGRFPVELVAGMRICQLCLFRMDGVVERPYGSGPGPSYNGQTGPTISRLRL